MGTLRSWVRIDRSRPGALPLFSIGVPTRADAKRGSAGRAAPTASGCTQLVREALHPGTLVVLTNVRASRNHVITIDSCASGNHGIAREPDDRTKKMLRRSALTRLAAWRQAAEGGRAHRFARAARGVGAGGRRAIVAVAVVVMVGGLIRPPPQVGGYGSGAGAAERVALQRRQRKIVEKSPSRETRRRAQTRTCRARAPRTNLTPSSASTGTANVRARSRDIAAEPRQGVNAASTRAIKWPLPRIQVRRSRSRDRHVHGLWNQNAARAGVVNTRDQQARPRRACLGEAFARRTIPTSSS